MDETREGSGAPVAEATWAMPTADGPAGWAVGGAGPNPPWIMSPPPPLPAPRAGRRRGRYVALTGSLVLVAAAAGVGIGHQVWHSPGSVSASAQSGGTLPGGLGGSGSGTAPGAGGNSGQLPFGSGGGFGGGTGDGTGGSSGSGGSSGTTAEGSGAPSNVSAIASEVAPGLVDVNSTFGYQSAAGAGTGIVLTSNGEILTNNHVINGATSVSVTDIGNGKTYTASVVGYDSTNDVAVLQLQGASGLQTAKLDTSAPAVGTPVVAIGNAGGTGGTPTSAGGSITALNQSITAADELDGSSEQLTGLIQVNADVQSGDSGGSLVNASGEVVGMDTAASSSFSFSSSGSSGNQGYAIPIAQATSIVGQIEAGQSSSDVHVGSTAFLGVLITPSTDQSGSAGGSAGGSSGGFGNPGTSTQAGALVSGVLSGGTASSAGLVEGDVITTIDGQTVGSASDLTHIVGGLRPGQKVELGWVDSSGQSHTANVDLGSGPPA
jgi:S1-C subfamily serine protease